MTGLTRRAIVRRLWGVALLVLVTAGLGQVPGSPSAAVPPAGALAALNYAPASRTFGPKAVYSTSGSVANPANVLSGAATRISGTGSALSLDFGAEVGGLVTLSCPTP